MTTKKTNDDQPTPKEIAQAQKEGVLDAVKAAATTQGIDELRGEEPVADKYLGKDEIMPWAHVVEYSLEELKAALDPKAENLIPENKVAGLLGLERGGKNRTDFVKLYMDRLGIKSPYEVTDAGPSYTNDVSSVTQLKK